MASGGGGECGRAKYYILEKLVVFIGRPLSASQELIEKGKAKDILSYCSSLGSRM